jgi:hypothetical protein
VLVFLGQFGACVVHGQILALFLGLVVDMDLGNRAISSDISDGEYFLVAFRLWDSRWRNFYYDIYLDQGS